MAQTDVTTYTPISGPGVQTRLNDEEERALIRTLREAGSLGIGGTGGPENDAFEKDFASFVGCPDAVAVNSGSSALELCAILSRIGRGDEVILS